MPSLGRPFLHELLSHLLPTGVSHPGSQGPHQRVPDLGGHVLAVPSYEEPATHVQNVFTDHLLVLLYHVLDIVLVFLISGESSDNLNILKIPLITEEINFFISSPKEENRLLLNSTLIRHKRSERSHV